MQSKISRLFQYISKDKSDGGKVNIPSDYKLWPQEWREIIIKTYKRFEKIDVYGTKLESALGDVLGARMSERNFSGLPLSHAEIGTIIVGSIGQLSKSDNEKTNRPYPSAGALYPVETYLIVPKAGEINAGVYHFNAHSHELDVLSGSKVTEALISSFCSANWVQKAAAFIVLTAVFDRNEKKYGTRGLRYTYLEAGHIGQNIALIASALKLKSCGLGGVNDHVLEKILDIDGISESVVYTIAIGK